jgi:hypothetical protein
MGLNQVQTREYVRFSGFYIGLISVYWPFPLKAENISILIKDRACSRTLELSVGSPAR